MRLLNKSNCSLACVSIEMCAHTIFRLEPNHSLALGALGTILTQQGRFQHAWDILDARIRPPLSAKDLRDARERETAASSSSSSSTLSSSSSSSSSSGEEAKLSSSGDPSNSKEADSETVEPRKQADEGVLGSKAAVDSDTDDAEAASDPKEKKPWWKFGIGKRFSRKGKASEPIVLKRNAQVYRLKYRLLRFIFHPSFLHVSLLVAHFFSFWSLYHRRKTPLLLQLHRPMKVNQAQKQKKRQLNQQQPQQKQQPRIFLPPHPYVCRKAFQHRISWPGLVWRLGSAAARRRLPSCERIWTSRAGKTVSWRRLSWTLTSAKRCSGTEAWTRRGMQEQQQQPKPSRRMKAQRKVKQVQW